jgi:hypothetical protein
MQVAAAIPTSPSPSPSRCTAGCKSDSNGTHFQGPELPGAPRGSSLTDRVPSFSAGTNRPPWCAIAQRMLWYALGLRRPLVERSLTAGEPHTPRRAQVAVRAHLLLRIHVGRGPRAPEQACAQPLVHFCAAGHSCSVFGHRRDPWQHSRPHRASSAWPRAVMSGAAATSVACFEQSGSNRAAVSMWRGTRAVAARARLTLAAVGRAVATPADLAAVGSPARIYSANPL